MQVRKKYAPRGVEFVGLTMDDARSLKSIQEYLEKNGINWPIGYGAYETLRAFEANYLPAVWVIGTNGKVVWSYDSETELEAGIEKALGS